nr:MAG TPA: hypothetical protein [Caudoviricetes sp.]
MNKDKNIIEMKEIIDKGVRYAMKNKSGVFFTTENAGTQRDFITDIANDIAENLYDKGFRNLDGNIVYMDNDMFTIIALNKPFEQEKMEAVNEFCKKITGHTFKGDGYTFTLTKKQVGELWQKYNK